MVFRFQICTQAFMLWLNIVNWQKYSPWLTQISAPWPFGPAWQDICYSESPENDSVSALFTHICISRPAAYLLNVWALLWLGVYIALSLEIKADAHVRGYVGEKIKLKCTFRSTSSITDKLTIDWTYRPPSSSRTESVSISSWGNFFESSVAHSSGVLLLQVPGPP